VTRDLPVFLREPFEVLEIAVVDASTRFSSSVITNVRSTDLSSSEPCTTKQGNEQNDEVAAKVQSQEGLRDATLGFNVNDSGGFAVDDEAGVTLPAAASAASPGDDLGMVASRGLAAENL